MLQPNIQENRNTDNIRIQKGELYEESYDNIYVNVELYNPYKPIGQNLPIRADVNVTQQSNILDIAGNYKIAINRFSIPGNRSLFIYPLDGDNLFRIEIYNTTSNKSIIKNLNYIEPCNACLYQRGIYFYNTMLGFVNTAFKEAYDELKILDNTFTAAQAPKMIYNPITQLFQLQLSADYITNQNWKIRMSSELFIGYFPSFLNTAFFEEAPLHLPIQFVVDTSLGFYNTALTIFNLQNEAPCIEIWDQLAKIIFISNTIPVNPEIISSSDGKTEQILLDFEPTPQIQGTTQYQYQPSLLRWVNLISNNPLNTIQIAVELQYKNGIRTPLFIQVNESMTVKFLIRGLNSHLTN